jgi:hypothetical protein
LKQLKSSFLEELLQNDIAIQSDAIKIPENLIKRL